MVGLPKKPPVQASISSPQNQASNSLHSLFNSFLCSYIYFHRLIIYFKRIELTEKLFKLKQLDQFNLPRSILANRIIQGGEALKSIVRIMVHKIFNKISNNASQ
jgi:hypothetical protein